jgi:hypothetical protein
MESVLEKQRHTGAYICDILVEDGVVEEGALLALLARQYKIPHLCLEGYALDETLLSLVPRDLCLRYRVVPIDMLGRNLTLAMINPFDTEALEAIHQRCATLQIRPILCARCHFDAVAERLLERRHRACEIFGTLRRRTDRNPSPGNRPLPDSFRKRRDAAVVDATATADAAMPADTPAGPSGNAAEGPLESAPRLIPLEFLRRGPQDGPSVSSARVRGPAGSVHPAAPPDPIGCPPTTAMVSAMRNTFATLLRRVALFRGVSPESVAQLFARARMIECESGALIFQQGEPNRCVYVVLSGAVEMRDADGTVDMALPGEIFGEAALLNSAAASASARANEPSCLLQLTIADITQNLPAESVVQLMINITVTLSRRLRTVQNPPRL